MLEARKALEDRAAAAVEMALDAGADGVWASASSSRSTSTELRNGELELMQESNSRRLSVELYVAGRYFAHSTSDLRDASLKAFVKEAVAMTRVLEADPHRLLPDPALYRGRSEADLDAVDPKIAEIDPQTRIARCKEIDACIHGQSGVISALSSMHDGSAHWAAASSNGFSGAASSTHVSMSGSATLEDADDKRPESGMGAGARHLADLPETRWIGDEALRRARARLGARKGPTLKTAMVVDRTEVGRLIRDLLGPAHGRAVQQNQSMWAERVGKRVLSKRFELADEPHLPRAMGSRAFDDEGIATQPRVLVRNGTLQALLLDVYYANKLGRPANGGSTSNLVVEPGRGDLTRLVAEVGRGVYVTDWLGGNADGTTGDFSLGLCGHLIERGEIGPAVAEMNLTGNIIDLFSRVAAVGDDVWTYGRVRSPTLVFDGVSFSGA